MTKRRTGVDQIDDAIEAYEDAVRDMTRARAKVKEAQARALECEAIVEKAGAAMTAIVGGRVQP